MAVEAKNEHEALLTAINNEHEALLTAINNERHNELIEENNCYTEQCGTFSYCKDWIKPITKEQYAQFENIISPPY